MLYMPRQSQRSFWLRQKLSSVECHVNHALYFEHSEASWALSHARRRRAHLVAVIFLWRLATTFQIQIQIQRHARIDYKLAVLTYKTRSTSTPSFLSHHIRPRESARYLCSSAAPLLYKPTIRTHFADWSCFPLHSTHRLDSLTTDITSR